MGLDKLDLWNRALGRISASPVASINEQSMAASYCRRFYKEVVDNMLEGPHEWSFAKLRARLALQDVNDRPREWAYAYRLPADMGSPIRIIPDLLSIGDPLLSDMGDCCSTDQWSEHLDRQIMPYVIEGETLYCNVPIAILSYIGNDPTMMRVSKMADRAIATELASLLAASPVKKSAALAKELAQTADLMWSRAIADDRNNQPEEWGNYLSETLMARHDMCMGGHHGHGGSQPTPTTTPPPPPPPPPAPSPLPPSVISAPVITGSTVKGNSLTVSTGAWLNSPTAFHYQWKDNGTPVGTDSATYLLAAGDVGGTITCIVTASNGQGSASSSAAGVGPVIDLVPVNTLAPVISGTPTTGQTLSTTQGTWTNNPTSYAYQWLRNGSAIGGATASTYLLDSADAGGNISCRVTASNSGGAAGANSNTLGPVGTGTTAPVNTALPTITGSPVVGQTLHTSNGTWDITPTSFTYQWYKDGVALTDFTGDAYLIEDIDVGSVFHCSVTAYNIAAASIPAASTDTSAVVLIDLTNAITAFTRTSSSGTVPMQWTLAFGSNVYEGYGIRVEVFSNGALLDDTHRVTDFYYTLTHDDLQPSADLHSQLTANGWVEPTALQWVRFSVFTQSPNGIEYRFVSNIILSPTDQAIPAVWNNNDKTSDNLVVDASTGLTLTCGGAAQQIRMNRALSGKIYSEHHLTNANLMFGVADATQTIPGGPSADNGMFGGPTNPDFAVYWHNGFVAYNGATPSGYSTVANGGGLDMAVDTSAKKVWFRTSAADDATVGAWFPGASANPATGVGGLDISAMTGALFAAAQFENAGQLTSRFASGSWLRSAPSGFGPA
jgi:hypothetical protein